MYGLKKARNGRPAENGGSKGQVATEYLIILAIVVIISLIVVGVLRSFIELRPGFETVKSKIEWASQDIVLTAHTVYSNGTAVLLLSNNINYPVSITEVGVGKTPVRLREEVLINPGQEETVTRGYRRPPETGCYLK